MAIISSLEKDQVDDAARLVFEEFEKEAKNVPEWVKVMAHSPRIVKEFTELFKSIMGSGDVNPYLKWKIGYTVSQLLKCPFCVDVTEKMLKKFGADDKLIKNIKEKKKLSEKEERILGLVKDITEDAHLDNPSLINELKKEFTEAQIVEIVSVIGLFNYINRFNNTLAILPK
ncbi:MAG: hypothetical protein GF387_00140 [Candidatus Portnoybacteria bacterium]|nr:hypothetical protein [Candidatus Portnoybacteria bacterium]